MELKEYSALELGAKLRKKEIGCIELTQYALDLAKQDDGLNAYINVFEEKALHDAAKVQKQIDGGEALSPLAGVPMAVKDNICAEGLPTTCASKMLESFRPAYSATVVERLRNAQAIIIGKTNMDEFAMGGSNESSYFGSAKNPWDNTCVPGGSSGGSAAAVAAGSAVFALGSDTGGSIRQPCSFCGITGIKPTYGAVSRYGLIAFASSLDQIGPMGRTVEDCAAVLELIAGKDRKDATSAEWKGEKGRDGLGGRMDGIRIGIPREYFADGLDGEIQEAVMQAAKEYEAMGAQLVDIAMPMTDYAVPAYYVVCCAEASSNLSRYDGIKYGFSAGVEDDLIEQYIETRSKGFGMEVKRRIMLGSFVLSSGYYDAYYKKAMQARELIQRGFYEAFESCDMILGPVAPTTAYRMGENITDPVKMYLGDIYTVAVNMAGLPALSLPCGFDAKGLPIGMQLIGKPFGEGLLCAAGHAFQLQTDYHTKHPEGGVHNAI